MRSAGSTSGVSGLDRQCFAPGVIVAAKPTGFGARLAESVAGRGGVH
jgi:hypothetical protein